jgi:putative exosortase-associated protein (TIGR04073 family)
MQQSAYSNPVGANRTFPPVNDTNDPQQQSFGQKGNNKALNAFANLTTSTLEIPKNIINTMNQSNFFYGVFGGFLKGLVNTLGRTGCGIVDLITLPLPTQPIVYPVYIWMILMWTPLTAKYFVWMKPIKHINRSPNHLSQRLSLRLWQVNQMLLQFIVLISMIKIPTKNWIHSKYRKC